MKRPLVLTVLVLALGIAGLPVLAQPTIYVSPDVPTEPDLPSIFLPWEVIEHSHLAAIPYGLEFGLPGDPAIDALHKMDRPGFWLVSVEAPDDLGGSLAVEAEPRDVILVDLAGGVLSFFFDGSCVGGVVPVSSSIDALYLEDGDGGPLVVSFDVPTTIGATFQPSELVRYRRTGAGPCGWTLAGSVIDFGLALATYFPGHANVTGADEAGGRWILALDVPTDLGPPGATLYTPGQIVSTDGVTVGPAVFDDLTLEGAPGWPVSALVDALTCQANPGRINSPTDQILLDKSGAASIDVLCPASCSSGGEAYGLYEGSIASINPGGVYDHVAVSCTGVCPGTITYTPPAFTSHYYIVVPHNFKEEGSYCTDSSGVERPQPGSILDRCAAVQTLTACP